MSRIDDVKQKYPELNISIIDLFSRLDRSGNNKYLGMICKVVSNILEVQKNVHYEEIQSKLKELGFNITGMSIKEHAALSAVVNAVGTDMLKDFKKFMEYNERGLIENKDLNSYFSMSQVKKSIEEADEKSLLKELERTTHVVHNDENWLVVRPLSFAASAKYGATTKWCTTYNDRSYFLKYWRKGILAYFINKKTNAKWAVFKSLDNSSPELSWWNVLDKKVEFFDIEFDDYMLPVIKALLKSPQTNEGLCSYDIRVLVERECLRKEELKFPTSPDYTWEWSPTVNPYTNRVPNPDYDVTVTTTQSQGIVTTNPCREIEIQEPGRTVAWTVNPYRDGYIAGEDPVSAGVQSIIDSLAERRSAEERLEAAGRLLGRLQERYSTAEIPPHNDDPGF